MNVFQREQHIKDVRRQWIGRQEDEDGNERLVHYDEHVGVYVHASGELFETPQTLLSGEYPCILTLIFTGDGPMARYFFGSDASSVAEAIHDCEHILAEQVAWFSRITEDDNRSESRVFRQEANDAW